MAVDPRWRKVTKKHPGKKWEDKLVIVAYISLNGNHNRMAVGLGTVPKVYVWPHEVWNRYCDPITHWMPWPEPPEMPKEVE